ncbi:MAG TPA: cation:proton antiporter [Vicinamibacterales bacterium]|nr:cation:proton antiporter [Vicinamibacterales bacterium]
MSNQQLAIQFFLQLTVILLACRVVGGLMRFVGQPRVMGEMIAGVLLGPSLLGAIAPSMHAALFPPASLGVMSVVSQLGLVLYMFVVGTHLHTDFIKQAFRGAMLISLAGVIAPFVLGAALASFLHTDGRFFAAGVSSWQSMIYLGAAMSVTAFPVLARIIQERGIAGTALGTLALAAGATDDAIAWCLLAIVLAGFNSHFSLAAWAIMGGAAYAAIVLVFVRPLLAKMGNAAEREGSLGVGGLMLILAMLMAGAWFTDTIGVHAVFGAFVMGVAMPRGVVTKDFSDHIEPLASALLVPLFFAYSGFSTRMGLLWSGELLLLAVVVILIASTGKGVACWAAARFAGRPNREALAMGALMNARGLMELIILNIGLERGLITPTLFAVMVMMTIATTVAAGPLFDWAWKTSPEVPDAAGVPVR